MRIVAASLLLVSSVALTIPVFSNPALAGADDAKWIAQCLADNADAKVPVEKVTIYCTCMNEKMEDGETKSITQWEKSHPKEQKECDALAGWK